MIAKNTSALVTTIVTQAISIIRPDLIEPTHTLWEGEDDSIAIMTKGLAELFQALD